jgi:hypothetical protein
LIRADHVAGGFFVAFGLLVLAISGDLPVGSLSFPGAGMMPKLMACLLMVLGAVLIARARESAPVASISWQDLRHAGQVVLLIAVAIALFQHLGFLITMALLLFALTFGAERRQPVAAAAFSLGVVALTWFFFTMILKTPLEAGLLTF